MGKKLRKDRDVIMHPAHKKQQGTTPQDWHPLDTEIDRNRDKNSSSKSAPAPKGRKN